MGSRYWGPAPATPEDLTTKTYVDGVLEGIEIGASGVVVTLDQDDNGILVFTVGEPAPMALSDGGSSRDAGLGTDLDGGGASA